MRNAQTMLLDCANAYRVLAAKRLMRLNVAPASPTYRVSKNNRWRVLKAVSALATFSVFLLLFLLSYVSGRR